MAYDVALHPSITPPLSPQDKKIEGAKNAENSDNSPPYPPDPS